MAKRPSSGSIEAPKATSRSDPSVFASGSGLEGSSCWWAARRALMRSGTQSRRYTIGCENRYPARRTIRRAGSSSDTEAFHREGNPVSRRASACRLPRRRYAARPVVADKGLFVASCSVTTTRRRRFMWVAWWTAPPAREPFRKPDAFSGGARSHEEALAQARRAAGVLLVEIEPYWARAWARSSSVERRGASARRGPPAALAPTAARPPATTNAAKATTTSIWETLGITARATADDLKRAFRQRALATHPDRGGDAEAFRQVQRAFKEAQRRIARRRQ